MGVKRAWRGIACNSFGRQVENYCVLAQGRDPPSQGTLQCRIAQERDPTTRSGLARGRRTGRHPAHHPRIVLLKVKRLAPDIDYATSLEEEIGANKPAELVSEVVGTFR